MKSDSYKSFNIENIKKYIHEKGIKPLIIIMLIGVLLIVISSPTKKINKKNSSKFTNTDIREEDDDESYKKELEKDLVNIIKRVNGVEDVSVMITFKSSSEEVILKDIPYNKEENKDEKAYSEEEETVIIEDDVGNSHPYVVKRIKPQVEGIVVGIKSSTQVVEREIMDVVQVLFDIPVHKIKIVKIN